VNFAVPVTPMPKTFDQQLGWVQERTAEGVVYQGLYRAVGLRYTGWILKRADGTFLFHILKPPITLLRDTEYEHCFRPRNSGWWLVDFQPAAEPVDVSSGIAAIQKALRTAFHTRLEQRRNRA